MITRPRVWFAFLSVLLGVLGGAHVALESVAHAQLSLRTSTVVNGNYAMIGNAMVDCPGAGRSARTLTVDPGDPYSRA